MNLIEGDRYPQGQVDRWAAYYDYKGAQFMESKKIQMEKAIKEIVLWNGSTNQYKIIMFGSIIIF